MTFRRRRVWQVQLFLAVMTALCAGSLAAPERGSIGVSKTPPAAVRITSGDQLFVVLRDGTLLSCVPGPKPMWRRRCVFRDYNTDSIVCLAGSWIWRLESEAMSSAESFNYVTGAHHYSNRIGAPQEGIDEAYNAVGMSDGRLVIASRDGIVILTPDCRVQHSLYLPDVWLKTFILKAHDERSRTMQFAWAADRTLPMERQAGVTGQEIWVASPSRREIAVLDLSLRPRFAIDLFPYRFLKCLPSTTKPRGLVSSLKNDRPFVLELRGTRARLESVDSSARIVSADPGRRQQMLD